MRKVLLLAVLAVTSSTQLLGCSSAHAEEPITLTTIADARSGVASPVDLGAPGR